MHVAKFVNSVFSSNSYIVHNGGEAVVIDIGDVEPLFRYLKENHLTLKAILITHTHYDHIYGVPRLMALYPGVPVYTSEGGVVGFAEPKYNFSRYHEDIICINSEKIISLQDNETITPCAGLTFKAVHTPGHDRSCVSYICGSALFSGDSYIPSVKVVDTFPRSDKPLARFWYERLSAMSAHYDIYPGHGPAATLES